MNNGVTNNNINNQNQTQSTQTVPIGNVVANTTVINQEPQIVNTQLVSSQAQPQSTPVVTPTLKQTQQVEVQQPPQTNQQPEITATPEPQTTKTIEEPPKEKKNSSGTLYTILIIIIIGLIGFTIYNNLNHNAQLKQLNFDCTPVTTVKKEKKLDINSTIVKDLYSKIQTNIREDLAEMELNDSMKLYLATKQIVPNKIFETDCHQFSPINLTGYTCVNNQNYTPQAFTEETLQIELKKLFGEKTEIPNQDIQLGKACVGGYHYIESRKEYVKGVCNNYAGTSFKATKRIKEAISKNSTIIIKEEVKYYGNEQLKVPDNLKSGTYIHTFKLDSNYNYVYVSKEYEEKY